jgi:hypothetical protein
MGAPRFTPCRAVIWISNNRRFLFKTFLRARELSVPLFLKRKISKLENWLVPVISKTSKNRWLSWWTGKESVVVRKPIFLKFEKPRFCTNSGSLNFIHPRLGKGVYIPAHNPKVYEPDFNDHTTRWKCFQLWAISRNRNWPQDVYQGDSQNLFFGNHTAQGSL